MDVLTKNKNTLQTVAKQSAKRFSPNGIAIRFSGINIIAPFGEKCKNVVAKSRN